MRCLTRMFQTIPIFSTKKNIRADQFVAPLLFPYLENIYEKLIRVFKMMDQSSVENLKRIAKYLRVSPGTITINDEKVNKIRFAGRSDFFVVIKHNLLQGFFLSNLLKWNL